MLGLVVQGLLPGNGIAAPPPDKGLYRLAVVLTSQQARTDLSLTLLTMIPRDDRPALKMPAERAADAIGTIDELGKDGRYHLNPERKTLELAKALKVWPSGLSEGEVPVLPTPEFFAKFGARIVKDPTSAFPDVTVTLYPFRLKLFASNVFTAKQAAQYGDGRPLSDEDRERLCDPLQTLIDKAKCHVELKLLALDGRPFVEILQMGFRVETRTSMPLDVATALIADVRAAIKASRKAEMPESDFSAIFIPEQGWKGVAQQTPTPAAVGAPQTAAANSPKDVQVEEIEDLWKRAGASLPQIAHPYPLLNSWPAINLYDPTADQNGSVMYGDWLKQLLNAPVSLADGNCKLSSSLPSHADAAASVLFPSFVRSRLLKETNPPAIPANYLPGAIQGQSHLLDPPPLSLSDADTSNRPKIGLAVYTDVPHPNDPERLTEALNAQTSNRILIVSAPEKNVVPKGYNTSFDRIPSNQFDPMAQAVIDNCDGKPFPSCLGMLPRVLVVAPVEQLLKYAIGASVVGLAAPGNSVPVLHDCGDQSAPRWGRSRGDGSSFSAPLVAAVIAKIMGSSKKEKQAAIDPLFALLRVLATADPLAISEGRDGDVAYGKLNAGRALDGATADEEGDNNRAAVYFKGQTKPKLMVVWPYPWANDYDNTHAVQTDADIKGAKKLGLAQKPRGIFRVANDDNFRRDRDFRNILRIVRRTDPDGNGQSRFDVFYSARGSYLDAPRVRVLRNATLGAAGTGPGSAGYCADSNAGNGIPACLYAWDGMDPKGFQLLDLSTVTEIVLSPNHLRADPLAGFNPVDFVLAPQTFSPDRPKDSPWRIVFCEARVADPVLRAIVREQNPDSGLPFINAAINSLTTVHASYCSAPVN